MRLELCPKPIQKPSQSPPKPSRFFAKFSKHRDGFFPQTESEPVFHKHGACFSKSGASQKRWRISPKSVMDFLKIGDGFPQSRWRISQNRWRISQKSVTDFPEIGGWFPESPASLAGTPTPKAKNTKRIFKYVHTCSKHKNNEGFPARNHSWSLQENANEGEPVDFLRQHVEMYLQTWHVSMRVWDWCSVSSFRLSVCRWIPGQQPLPCSSVLEGSIQNASNKQCWVARTKNYSKKSWQSRGRNSVLIAWLRPFFQRNGFQEKRFSFLSASCCN